MSSSLGDRLRKARKRRGLTQQDLASGAAVSVSLIRKLEQGEQQDTRMETAHRLAAALRIPTTRLISRAELPTPPVHADELWRPVQQAIEQPPQQPEEPATVDGVTAALGAARAVHFRAEYAQLAVMLPGLIRDADALGAGVAERQVRARVLHLAASALTQTRQFVAAEAALDRAEDDAPDAATGAGVMGTRCWWLVRQGHLSPARELATRWADEMEPRRVSRATADDLAVWGWTLLEVASAAVRDNRPGEAADALRLARGAAVMTGRELQHGTRMNRWGPRLVSYKRAEYAMVLNQPDRALAIAGRPPRPSTDTNVNRHLLDVAMAHVHLRQHDEAMGTLLGIYQAAPEWLAHQVYARDVLGELIGHRRTLTTEMRELADAIGLPL